MTDDELIIELEGLRNTMIAVATGGPRIADVNEQYQRVFAAVAADLARRHIANPITHGSLWDWYGRWSSGDLPSYQSRRVFVGDLINPLISRIRTGRTEEVQPTGWQRVDRTVGELRDRLAWLATKSSFRQSACWAAIHSFHWPRRYISKIGTRRSIASEPGDTDAKRMLAAYLAVELAGGGQRRGAAPRALGARFRERRSASPNRDVSRCRALC